MSSHPLPRPGARPSSSPSSPVDPHQLREAIERHVVYTLGERWEDLGSHDVFMAVSLAARDLLMRGLLASEAQAEAARAKRVYYLSLEFLIGRSLANNLLNLGVYDACREALRQRMPVNLTLYDQVEEEGAEPQPGFIPSRRSLKTRLEHWIAGTQH